jgi:hypothetical protein
MSEIKKKVEKIGNIHIQIKYIVASLIFLLIICYFFKEQVLFEDLLKMLVPFLIGASVKVAYYFLPSLV